MITNIRQYSLFFMDMADFLSCFFIVIGNVIVNRC